MTRRIRLPLYLVLIHAVLVIGVVFSLPRTPRAVSRAFRASAATANGFDAARLDYSLPVGYAFVAERVWTLHHYPFPTRYVFLLEFPTILGSQVLSAIAFPALSRIEPWIRSWFNLLGVLLIGSLQWGFVGSLVSHLIGRVRRTAIAT